MVFERRHLCLLLKTMTSALFARDALSSALHRFSTAYCETGGFSAGHCARHLWHWSKSWAGICGIGWKIAAVFVLIDSVAFGKEMYCSFIFTSLTMWRFACFINVITTLLWGGSVNMILLSNSVLQKYIFKFSKYTILIDRSASLSGGRRCHWHQKNAAKCILMYHWNRRRTLLFIEKEIARVCFSLWLYYHLWREVFLLSEHIPTSLWALTWA